MTSVSAVVVSYNSVTYLPDCLRSLRSEGVDSVIVVDNASSDGSAALVEAEDPAVKVLHTGSNLGFGSAANRGVAATAGEHVRGELVLIQDADLEYDPEDWPRLLRPILRGRSQVVYGSRFSGEGGSMAASDWVGNHLLSLVTNLLYNTSLSDMECGYKLFTRKVIDDITIESDRFDFEPEITAKVLRRGHRIYEVPVSYSGRPASEGRKFAWRDGVRALSTLARYRWGAIR